MEPPISQLPAALSSLLAFYSFWRAARFDDVLVRLAISMRAHQRGGLLPVVPGNNRESGRESIVKPISYSVLALIFGIFDGLPLYILLTLSPVGPQSMEQR